MVEEPQGQSGLDGEIRVPPLPTPPAASAGRPGSDRFRGHPHRHIAAANKGPVVGRPVRYAIFRLVRGMDLRLHPCSVAAAEGHEKCSQTAPARRVFMQQHLAASRRPRVRRALPPRTESPGARQSLDLAAVDGTATPCSRPVPPAARWDVELLLSVSSVIHDRPLTPRSSFWTVRVPRYLSRAFQP